MVAFAALFIWPLVVVILFQKCHLTVALLWSIVAGYLLLPTYTGINLPVLPTLDKNLIPSASAMLMAIIVLHRQSLPGFTQRVETDIQPAVLPGWIPRGNIIRILLLLIIGGAFLTAATNGDSLIYGPLFIPGLRLYDGFSAALTTMAGLLPFLLARKFLASPDSHQTVLMILCLAGLAYTLPALYEVRMSPQLSRMIYGFYPGSWLQALRGDGFRPLVFLEHGLRLGIFFTVTILSALVYSRTAQSDRRWFFLAAALWIFATLIVAKTLGALLIALALIPVALAFGTRVQLLVATILAVIVISFPVLRSAGLVPVDHLISYAEQIDPARARSLAFRFNNEDLLLSKANERPAFGWGAWGRSRVYNEDGRDISITDGYWAVLIGRGGWTAYIGQLGILVLPIILLTLRRRRYEITLATSGLCLVLAANLVDLLPNSPLTPITWLMAGALVGRLELQRIGASQNAATPASETVQASRYSRPRPAPIPMPPAEPSDTTAPRKQQRYTRQTTFKSGSGGAKT